MLIIRRYKDYDKEEVLDLLKKEKIRDLDLNNHIYVAIEDDIIIGVCKTKVGIDEGFLKYIVVKESNRGEGLGNGILRATFNNLERDGIEKVYFDENNSYLLKIGFVENDENKLELNLPDFFKPSCKCSVKCGDLENGL